MDCCLIVYQPYRPLVQYMQDLGGEGEVLQLAWRIVNDSLRTDVCLLFPPYEIALSCIHMACVVHQKDCKQWFAELNTDLDRIMEITRYILNLYELWKSYDERKEIQGLLQKMPKPNTQSVPRWLEPNVYGACDDSMSVDAGHTTQDFHIPEEEGS